MADFTQQHAFHRQPLVYGVGEQPGLRCRAAIPLERHRGLLRYVGGHCDSWSRCRAYDVFCDCRDWVCEPQLGIPIRHYEQRGYLPAPIQEDERGLV